MLSLIPWSKSGQQNSEEEETAFKITLILEGLQLPRAKCPSPPISHQSVLHILTKELATRSVSARWVPKLLIDAKQRIQFSISCNNLRWSEGDPADFLDRSSETWIHHFMPGTKQLSKQWKQSASPPPKKAKVVQSAGEVMTSDLCVRACVRVCLMPTNFYRWIFLKSHSHRTKLCDLVVVLASSLSLPSALES